MNDFLAALSVHELGHFNIGREAADDIDNAIHALPQMATCKALGLEANRVGEDRLDKARAADTRYDAETAHGTSQGAVLRD